MTLENAKVLHKHFITIGRLDKAKELVDLYPELAEPESEAKVFKKKLKKASKKVK